MAANEGSEFLESWEEMADSCVLDKQIAQMQAAITTNHENNMRCAEKKPMVIFQEEDGRTRYSPSEPTVKILKRPSNGIDNNSLVNGDNSRTPKVPVKSLQQREQEYAEARLRIMGEAHSPEEGTTLDDKTVKIQKVPKIDILRAQENETIVRHPRGPDGTRGFTLQR